MKDIHELEDKISRLEYLVKEQEQHIALLTKHLEQARLQLGFKDKPEPYPILEQMLESTILSKNSYKEAYQAMNVFLLQQDKKYMLELSKKGKKVLQENFKKG